MLISSENIAVSGNSITAQDDFLQRILSMKSISGRAIEHFFRQKKKKRKLCVKIDFLGRCIFLPFHNFIRSISNSMFSMSIEKFKTKEWKEDAVIIL